MTESGIEIAAAPEWLVKLESRREQIKAKLGHESGNGAPCIVCGAKCPGLDLHFWRKVCRNCKCRKEQHDCKDDEVTGWAQFEILGAIRSKPAYIKISELTDKPVQVDWIPPNVTPEIASDYMTQLGQQNIPIAGSEAAEKRKQQLEYQVPPHDLDASLCHNLSENEAAQLVQYVEKIKKNCVGQGNVVRIGDHIKHLPASGKGQVPSIYKDKIVSQLLSSEPIKSILSGSDSGIPQRSIVLKNDPMESDFIGSQLLSDKTKYKLKLMKINSEAINSAVLHGPEIDSILNALNSVGIEFKEKCNLLGPLENFRKEYLNNPKFRAEIDSFVASALNHINEQSSNQRAGENLFHSPLPLKNFARHDLLQYQETPARKLDFNKKPVLPLSPECRAALKKDRVLADILNSEPLKTTLHAPVHGSTLVISRKPMFPDFISSPFLSPASKARLERMKINTQTIQSAVLDGPFYDELLSKLEGSGINYAHDSILQPIDEFREEFLSYDSDNDFQKEIIDFVKNSDLSEFGVTPAQVPNEAELRKTAQHSNELLTNILSEAAVQEALKSGLSPTASALQIYTTPLKFGIQHHEKIPSAVLNKLHAMNIDEAAIKSAVVCGPVYDKLFHQLNKNRINYASDCVLEPIAQFRAEFLRDDQFRKALTRYVTNPEPLLFEPSSYVEELPPESGHLAKQLAGMHVSHSDDSGFGSVPPTPNYSTYPGGVLNPAAPAIGSSVELNAREGMLTSIPAIQDMNMYPEVRPSAEMTHPIADSSIVSNPNASSSNKQHAPELVVCSGCNENIVFGEVAVKAERAGKSAAWHPQCFKCDKCEELLADLVYFYHGGRVYCARDLANILKIPRCSACDELIFTKEYTAAEDATFHIKHFCCYHCDAPLAGQQYVPDEKSNMPLCLTCYDTYFAKSCNFCKGIIGPAEQGVAFGSVHWHSACFLCSGQGCGKSLIGGRFCIKNELPFCSPQCLKSIIF